MSGISDKAIKLKYVQNKYRYNRKELQNQEFTDGTGLEWYDYGARMYDNQIGRWMAIDSKSENHLNWSPYAYVYDNPPKLIDPDGRDGEKPRNAFYNSFGPSAMAAAAAAGAENKFKGLYLVAQRRTENGFKLAPPGNNIMNVKLTGNAGKIREHTHEDVKNKSGITKNVSVTAGFGNFTSVEAGFDAYLNLLKSRYSGAYEALTDDNKTIDDFIDGLRHGSLGSYATDQKYDKKIRENFADVVADYKKELTTEYDETEQSIQDILNDKSNYVNYRTNTLTTEAGETILGYIFQAMNLQGDILKLAKLK